MTPRKPKGIVLGMPEAEYHARPELSSTGAKKLLKSPGLFDYWRTHPEPPKREFDLGSAIHSKVLGVGYEIVIIEHPDYRTNAAKDERDAARAEGKIPVLRHQYDEVAPAAEAVLADPDARAILEQDGDAEASVFARDPEHGIGLRARFDFLPRKTGHRAIAADLKSIGTSAHPDDFAKSVARLGYDVSQAHYLHTLSLVEDRELDFVFIAVETEPPHFVEVYTLDREFAEIGVKKAARARRIFAECSASGVWPKKYGGGGVTALRPPVFHVYDFQDHHEGR